MNRATGVNYRLLKLLELLKTAAIVALIASAVYLTYRAWFFSMPSQSLSSVGLWGLFKQETVLPAAYTEYEEYAFAADAMRPLRCAVRNETGLYGVWERSAANTVYGRARSILAESIGSLQTVQMATTQEWKAALQDTMVLLDFEGEVPLPSIAQELGVETVEVPEIGVRYIILTADEDGTVRFLCRANDRNIYECETTVEGHYLQEFAAGYDPNDCRLGAELDSDSFEAPAELLLFYNRMQPPSLETYRVLEDMSGVDADRVIDTLLTAFDCNPYTTNSYTEADGARVYVEQLRTMRVYEDGRVSYYAPEADIAGGTTPDSEEQTALIGEAGRLVEQAIAPNIGDAGVYLVRSYMNTETGRFVVLFGCEVGGVPVLYDEGYLMRAEFINGVLVTADLRLDGYRRAGVGNYLLPEIQALAAAASEGAMSSFGLYYLMQDETLLNADWYRFS